MNGRGALTLAQPRPLNAPGPPSQPPAVTPGSRNIVRARTVIVRGAGGGEFVYDAAGNLRSANVGGVTTDPLQGITCQQGFSTFNGHGSVINLLSTAKGAFFQYFDNGTAVQGGLILSTASVASVDPVTGANYPAGQQGINPAFGSFTQLNGSAILFGVGVSFSRAASVGVQQGAGASPPYLETDSPEQTTASHTAFRLQGESPDGTVPAQGLLAAVAGGAAITRATNALLEVQGSLALAGIAAPAQPPAGNGLQYADTAGFMRMLTGLAGDTNKYSGLFSTPMSSGGQLVNSTSFTTIGGLSAPVGIQKYAFLARLVYTGAGTAGTANFQMSGPAVTGQWISATFIGATLLGVGFQNGALGPVDSPGVATSAEIVDIEGEATFTAAGTLALQAAISSGGSNYTVNKGHLWLFAM